MAITDCESALAQEIKGCVSEFNRLIKEAESIGISVEIMRLERREISDRLPIAFYQVSITKTL